MSDIHTIYVFGEHTSKAGLRAWPDASDTEENMDDYECYEGTTEDLNDVARCLEVTRCVHCHKVAAIIRSEIA